MRRLGLLAFIFCTLSARAVVYPAFSEKIVTMRPGETRTVDVTRSWSGTSGFYYEGWTFTSDAPHIAYVSGRIGKDEFHQQVRITAVAPGVAHALTLDTPSGYQLNPRVAIAVIGDPADLLYIAGPHAIRTGVLVTYTAVLASAADGVTYEWYSGDAGDTNHPLGTGPELAIVHEAPGTARYWVRAITPHSISTAFFDVIAAGKDDPLPGTRQRSARH